MGGAQGSAADHDQPLVLEALIGLGDRQWVRGLLRGEHADRRQRVAVAIGAGEDCVSNRLAQADINRLFVLRAKRHAVIIQQRA